MELELGLKLTKVADDFAAAELLISKDHAGPLFLCTQTESMFFLTAHLKGYKRRNIKIDINEDGSRIALSGEKPVQEMLMVGWKVVKKETEMRAFRKVFKIPSGVILDKIKARFNEDESVLTISMPKLVKGVTSIGIEEMKEEEMLRGETGLLQLVADEVAEGGTSQQDEPSEAKDVKVQEVDERVADILGLPESSQVNLEREECHELSPANVERAESTDSALKKLGAEKGHDLGEKIEKASKEKEISEATEAEPDQVSQQNELPSRNPVLEHLRHPDRIPLPEIGTQEKGTQTEEITKVVQEHGKPENDQVEPTCLKQPRVEDQVLRGHEVGQTEDGIQNKEAKEEGHPDQVLRGQEVGQTEDGIQNKEAKEEGSMDDEPNLGEKERELHDQSQDDKGHRRKSKKICAPMIVGSALFVSLLVFVIHFIRAKNQTSKKRN